MKNPLTALAFGLALITPAHVAEANDIREVTVRSHPSQGDVMEIAGATARLAAGTQGIFVNMDTAGLNPGHDYTLLLAVLNDPSACPSLPCSPKDVLKRSDAVASDVGYAGGMIAGQDGAARFAFYQETGPMFLSFFSNGLQKTEGVEVHLVLNDHGPAIAGREVEMLSSYRGGCREESLPGPMPESARSQGEPGPNQCRMVQFAQFLPVTPDT